jgi:hypothetical protein
MLAHSASGEGASGAPDWKAAAHIRIDAVVERVVSAVILSVPDGTFPIDAERDAGKDIRRAAESFVAAVQAQLPPKESKIRRVTISEDAIKSVFHLPISKAATELGVGLTVLKKVGRSDIRGASHATSSSSPLPLSQYCRVYEIHRWPFRKLKVGLRDEGGWQEEAKTPRTLILLHRVWTSSWPRFLLSKTENHSLSARW